MISNMIRSLLFPYRYFISLIFYPYVSKQQPSDSDSPKVHKYIIYAPGRAETTAQWKPSTEANMCVVTPDAYSSCITPFSLTQYASAIQNRINHIYASDTDPNVQIDCYGFSIGGAACFLAAQKKYTKKPNFYILNTFSNLNVLCKNEPLLGAILSCCNLFVSCCILAMVSIIATKGLSPTWISCIVFASMIVTTALYYILPKAVTSSRRYQLVSQEEFCLLQIIQSLSDYVNKLIFPYPSSLKNILVLPINIIPACILTVTLLILYIVEISYRIIQGVFTLISYINIHFSTWAIDSHVNLTQTIKPYNAIHIIQNQDDIAVSEKARLLNALSPTENTRGKLEDHANISYISQPGNHTEICLEETDLYLRLQKIEAMFSKPAAGGT